jgi:hypothetical protein
MAPADPRAPSSTPSAPNKTLTEIRSQLPLRFDPPAPPTDGELDAGECDESHGGVSEVLVVFGQTSVSTERRASIPPTPPSAAMSCAPSWRCRWRSISTTSPAKPALRRNGRSCCAISTASNRCASITEPPTGSCAPTPREIRPGFSNAPMSPCRPAPARPVHRHHSLQIRPKRRGRPRRTSATPT